MVARTPVFHPPEKDTKVYQYLCSSHSSAIGGLKLIKMAHNIRGAVVFEEVSGPVANRLDMAFEVIVFRGRGDGERMILELGNARGPVQGSYLGSSFKISVIYKE